MNENQKTATEPANITLDDRVIFWNHSPILTHIPSTEQPFIAAIDKVSHSIPPSLNLPPILALTVAHGFSTTDHFFINLDHLNIEFKGFNYTEPHRDSDIAMAAIFDLIFIWNLKNFSKDWRNWSQLTLDNKIIELTKVKPLEDELNILKTEMSYLTSKPSLLSSKLERKKQIELELWKITETFHSTVMPSTNFITFYSSLFLDFMFAVASEIKSEKMPYFINGKIYFSLHDQSLSPAERLLIPFRDFLWKTYQSNSGSRLTQELLIEKTYAVLAKHFLNQIHVFQEEKIAYLKGKGELLDVPDFYSLIPKNISEQLTEQLKALF